MEKIVVLDLHGVLLTQIRGDVIRTAFARLGPGRALATLMLCKMGVMDAFVRHNLGDIVRGCAAKATPLPGAMDALWRLTQMPGVRVNVCSAALFDGAPQMVQHYRMISPGLAAVNEYKLISPMQSKGDYLKQIIDWDNVVYVVDDSIKNLVRARNLGATPVIITKDAGAALRAQYRARAMAFETLGEFADYVRRGR